MDKTLQDLAWASLPKEARDYINDMYSKTSLLARKDAYELGILHTFENIFGVHNLTSDAEPDELEQTLEQTSVKVEDKPRFKKGDIVLCVPIKEVYAVEEYCADKKHYKLSRLNGAVTLLAEESVLETLHRRKGK